MLQKHYSHFIQYLKDQNLEKYIPIYEKIARKGVQFSLLHKSGNYRISSRFGGDPFFPKSFSWPTQYGRPLTFLFQFNLSEINIALGEDRFSKGFIYVFTSRLPMDGDTFDFHDREYIQYLYYPSTDGLAAVSPPNGTESLPEYALDLNLDISVPQSSGQFCYLAGINRDEFAKDYEGDSILNDFYIYFDDVYDINISNFNTLFTYPNSIQHPDSPIEDAFGQYLIFNESSDKSILDKYLKEYDANVKANIANGDLYVSSVKDYYSDFVANAGKIIENHPTRIYEMELFMQIIDNSFPEPFGYELGDDTLLSFYHKKSDPFTSQKYTVDVSS